MADEMKAISEPAVISYGSVYYALQGGSKF